MRVAAYHVKGAKAGVEDDDRSRNKRSYHRTDILVATVHVYASWFLHLILITITNE